MNYNERLREVKRMDTEIHSLNDKELLESWLTYGITEQSKEDDYLWYAKYPSEFKKLLTLYHDLIIEFALKGIKLRLG